MSVARECARSQRKPVSQWVLRIRLELSRFGKNRAGNIALLGALLATFLMILIGGAVDIGRWLNARSHTLGAMDSAVLAGARILRADSTDAEGAIQIAKAFYEQNVLSRFKLINDSVDFTVNDSGTSMSVSGTAFIDTPFLNFAGIDKLPVVDTSKADFSKGAVAAGDNAGKNLEISIMLDVTKSMTDDNLNSLKNAAKELIKKVVWADQDTYRARVALAPFADAVRPGQDLLDYVRGTHPSTHRFKDKGRWKDYQLTECVSERGGDGAYTDIAPYGNDMLGPVYTEDGECSPSSEVVPLTSDLDTLNTAIDELKADGWSAGHLGTAWAWYLLSPNFWMAEMPEASRPSDYNKSDVKKVVILMTNGEYNQQYDGAGVAIRDEGRGDGGKNGLSDAQARQVCDNIQEAGITVYTIGLGLKEKKAIETMSRCASTSKHFYEAETGEQLQQAFLHIATKLTPLYLSQ